MIIFLNMDGTAEKVVPEHIYQGSNNVTEITVVAPFAPDTAMQIGFILPDGMYWQSSDGARYMAMSRVEQETIPGVFAWTFTLPFSVTEREGDVDVAINALTTTGNTTSYLCKITVEKSVVPPLPKDQPQSGAYDLLQQYIAKLDARTIKVPTLVADINKVAPNAIQYVRENGTTSAVIVLEGGETAPIPVNAAGVVTIPKTAWQPVYSGETVTGYTTVISASLHGQMRDGATASDLWVSFGESDDGAISGAYQGYTVNESGDITINVSQQIDMTLRVWNGKGLVDEVARDMVEQETARAETEEANLQSQIDEIVQSGVDLTARAQIKDEKERAEEQEELIYSDIDQLYGTTERHSQQIAIEQGTIVALNEKVEIVKSYIPPSTSKTNQLADKAFVNSSINALAAFYITPTAAGDEAFATRVALLSATEFFSGGQSRVPTQNDYAIVVADESKPKGADGSYPTTRYSYQGGTYPNGQWEFQYIVNNTSLTQAQINAINSGITQAQVVQIGNNKTAIAAEVAERTNADAHLQEQIDVITSSRVTSVNGQTGAVNISADDIGAAEPTGRYDNMIVGEAKKLNQSKSIDGVQFDGTANITHYAKCDTPANNTTKVATIYSVGSDTEMMQGFELVKGARVAVKFVNTNTNVSPTLNVNGTGAKPIYFPTSTAVGKEVLRADSIIEFIFDGDYWVMLSGNPLDAYPIGAIYISTTLDRTPSGIFGGSWEAITSGYYLKAVTGLGNTGYHPAGLPNIMGELSLYVPETGDYSGALYTNGSNANEGTKGGSAISNAPPANGSAKGEKFYFDANKFNKIYGASTTVTPLNYGVYMWRRVA